MDNKYLEEKIEDIYKQDIKISDNHYVSVKKTLHNKNMAKKWIGYTK